MSELTPTVRFFGTGARLAQPIGSLPAKTDLAFSLDAQGITLSGGDPLLAWQLPYRALIGARAVLVGFYVELSGWVSGRPFLLTIPTENLGGGTPQELIALLSPVSPSPTTTMMSGHSDGLLTARLTMKRKSKALIASAVLTVAVVVALVLALILQSSPGNGPSTTSQAHALAASMNLTINDFHSTWQAENPATAPLSGLLGTGTASKETPKQKKIYDEVVHAYQTCVGLSNAKDRMFGTAGVAPIAQVPSNPYGSVENGNLAEAGSVTQYYASTQDVQSDLAQMKRPQFARCLSEVMARFTIAFVSPSSITTPWPTVVTKSSTQLGVFVTGAATIINYPTTTGTTPIEIGVTSLIYGHYEQVLYTFASPGIFPVVERQQLLQIQVARLAGVNGASNA